MDADLKKIKKLTDFMKKSGLLHLKSGDLELNLAPQAITPIKFEGPEEPNEPLYTEEQMLFWSAPGAQPTDKDVQ